MSKYKDGNGDDIPDEAFENEGGDVPDWRKQLSPEGLKKEEAYLAEARRQRDARQATAKRDPPAKSDDA